MLSPSLAVSRISLGPSPGSSRTCEGRARRLPQQKDPGRMLADRDSLLRRLHELRSEHRDLDTVITRLGESGADALQLQRLKKRKLKLKDEIMWLESRLIPDVIA
jgi:hypothetical protein